MFPQFCSAYKQQCVFLNKINKNKIVKSMHFYDTNENKIMKIKYVTDTKL